MPSATPSARALVVLVFCSLLEAVAMAESKLDITEEDREANAVRRQGVDSALIRYAAIALQQQQESSGIIVDVTLPPGILGGIEAQALLLEGQGSAVVPQTFDEFSFPQGSVVVMDSLGNGTSTASALLLYRRIIDFTVYALPPQYQFLGPPLGLLAFPYSISVTAAMDSAQTPLQELPVSVPTNELIQISLPSFTPRPPASISSSPLCALFAANGSIFISAVAASPNICTTDTLGDFALIYQSSSPSSSPSPPNLTAPSARSSSPSSPKSSSKNSKLVIAAVCISLAGLTVIVALALISVKLAEGIRRAVLARFSKNEETLQMSLVGSSRAPSAMVVRTKPTLEMDAADFNGVPP